MSEPEMDGTEQFPEWEVGVRITHDHDTWEHYHPQAVDEDEAVKKAKDMARNGLDSIAGIGDPLDVYIVSGPYEPETTEPEDTDTEQ